jgi:apolipoprotein N-acyltransferase
VLLGGVVLPVSFCGFDQWYLTWVAFVPLLFALDDASRRAALARGFVYGLIANLIGYYWIPYTIHEFGRFPQYLAWTFSLVLCAYQGVQYSLLAYLTVRLRERFGARSTIWVFPTVMVALETVYPLLFPIFMGNTQHTVPILIQACDLLGPLLVTAVVLAFNVSLYAGIKAAVERTRPWPWRDLAVGPAGLAALLVYGAIRIPMVEADMEAGTPLRVGIVQPSMGILEKWRDVEEGLARHERGSLDLERRGAQLIVWSEAAYTSGYINPRDRNLRELIVPELRTPLLAGALTVERGEVFGESRILRHNSAIMLDADRNIVGVSDKSYLLAFGEYIPFGDVFPQLYDASPNSGALVPGRRIVGLPLDFEGERWILSALICYEDILPRFTRTLVRATSPNLLVNMTNDAWFGDTNEPWIHLDLAKFRAIEHRRYLVRATNTGVSAFIDPVGRVVEHSEVFRNQTLLSDVRLLRGGPTVYAIVGDVLGYLALALVVAGLFLTSATWFRRPGPKIEGRAGVKQAAALLLAVGLFDLASVVFVYALEPARWAPTPPVAGLWVLSALAMVGAFATCRRRRPAGVHLGIAGAAGRLVLSGVLLAGVSSERLATSAWLVVTPLALAVGAAVNLWLWRDRCALDESAAPKAPTKGQREPKKKKKKARARSGEGPS